MKHQSKDDFSGYADLSASSNDLANLAETVDLQARLSDFVDSLEAELKQAKAELRAVSDEQLPELMEQCGMQTFTTSSGISVSVKEVIRASLPKHKQQEGIQWLRENGQGGMVKHAVSVAFGVGQDEQAAELLARLHSERYLVEEIEKVHPQTLSAFVRRALEDGAELPMDLLGVHRQVSAKIKNS